MGGGAIAGLACPPLEGRLGQIERARSAGAPRAIADGGYVVEAFGDLVFGATFEPAHGEPVASDAARAANREVLHRLRPELAASVSETVSRAAIRATTRDRLPFAGAPAPSDNASRVQVIGGLGSRRFWPSWSPPPPSVNRRRPSAMSSKRSIPTASAAGRCAGRAEKAEARCGMGE
jgi:hypothetical protein